MSDRFYDVIVIGRSLGALVAASLLARRDFTVLVVGQARRSADYQLDGKTLRRRAFTMLSATSPVWMRIIAEHAQSQTWQRRIAPLAQRLVMLSRDYRASARVGAKRLPFRSRLAILAASNVYGAIGEKVVTRGADAWTSRTVVSDAEKLEEFILAGWQAILPAPNRGRDGLWTRPA